VPFQTSTCTLRPLADGDAPSIARHANDREIWLNLRDFFPHPYSPADGEAFIAYTKTVNPQVHFGIEMSGDIVGVVSLKPGSDIERINCEIGYWLGRGWWGKGIMSDAVRAVTKHAFDAFGTERVFAVPFTRNPASCRVLEKAGFVREGTMRRSAIKDGLVLDQYLYASYRS
jgi:ribosomal-protein-alanine N-acetyltransferase